MQGEQGAPAAQPPQQPPQQRMGGRQQLWTTVRGLAVIIALLIAYYLLPSGSRIGLDGFAVLFCIGVVVLSALILILANRLLAADPAAAKVIGLLAVVCIAILFFARADYLLALEPGQFAELHTKTDALYFNVSTLATVGFGDVHATGQAARAAVTVQVVFNLVFIGLGVTLVTGLLKHRARSRSSGAGAGPPSGSSFPS
jgi:voltage-gated potassium channel